MRRLLLSLLVLAFTLPALAQAKHPFTFDDMMKLKRVGDPQVSPDGKWVIFSVVDVDLDANTKTPHIWIVPLDALDAAASGRAKTAGSSSQSDLSPIRTPTARAGRRMGSGSRFFRTKEGGSQVWIAEFDGATGTVTGVLQVDVDRDRSGRRTLVA